MQEDRDELLFRMRHTDEIRSILKVGFKPQRVLPFHQLPKSPESEEDCDCKVANADSMEENLL